MYISYQNSQAKYMKTELPGFNDRGIPDNIL